MIRITARASAVSGMSYGRLSSIARSRAPTSAMKRDAVSPPGWVDAKTSNVVKRGAIARSAGCRAVVSHSAVMPTAEIPVAPTRRFDQGCRTIQSSTSAPSATAVGITSDSRAPNDAPAPRCSITTCA